MAKRTVAMTLDADVVAETQRQCKEYGLTLSGVVQQLLVLFNAVEVKDERDQIQGVG